MQLTQICGIFRPSGPLSLPVTFFALSQSSFCDVAAHIVLLGDQCHWVFAGTVGDVLGLQGCLCQAECCTVAIWARLIDFIASGFNVEAGQWNEK